MVKPLYGAWIRIGGMLPWIELEGTFRTRQQARKAAREILKHVEIKIVNVPDQKKIMKTLATARIRR
jgi:hypothetical protein